MKADKQRQQLILFVTFLFIGFIIVFLVNIQKGTNDIIGYPAPAQQATTSASYPGPVTPTPTHQLSSAAQIAMAHVSSTQEIPVTDLDLANEETIELPASGRFLQRVTIINVQQNDLRVFKLYVDLLTGEVFENRQELWEQEEQAYQAQYGKLEIMLYERLQNLNNEDELPVAIWVVAEPGKTLSDLQATIYADLVAEYPEAQTAIEAYGKPMAVEDSALAKEINDEYLSRVAQLMEERVQPLAAEVEEGGFEITLIPGMPSFTAVLPKWYILELSSHPKAYRIYLIEGDDQPALDSAIPNSFAPQVWQSGVTGSDITIAILEEGNVDRNNSYLHHAPFSLLGTDVTEHATWVASIASSFHTPLTGMSPGSTVLSAGNASDDEEGALFALTWAINENDVYIANRSSGFNDSDNALHWIDHAFDYWARLENAFVVQASGNTGNSKGNLISPGKGWNVLTVGAYNDQNNTQWADDTMRSTSAYVNPCSFLSCGGDREKPEVVAVGGSVTALGLNEIPVTQGGTSGAAPQVSGLGALLVDRNSLLQYWPEAMRAIIMASANHNIEGPTIIPWGYSGDLKDGAGAINGLYADEIAQNFMTPLETCYSSCWWPVSLSLTYFTSLERYFHATPGQLVRVAISWWSAADGPAGNYGYDDLLTDLNLSIFAPDGSLIGYSLSSDNSYEMVEFVVNQTGTYRLVVTKFDSFEASNFLGIAVAGIMLSEKSYLPFLVKP